MRVICDIEANGLENPTQIWVIICLDIDTDVLHIFREITSNEDERRRFLEFADKVSLWVGHNFLGYDYIVLRDLLRLKLDIRNTRDTWILCKLTDFSRPEGHSIESYGEKFGVPKGGCSDFTRYSHELEERCISDVKICKLLWDSLLEYSSDPSQRVAIDVEHRFQLICNDLHENGFHFDVVGCRGLLAEVTGKLTEIDTEIENAFPPTLKPIKEVHPKFTKHGTLSKIGFKFVKDGDLSSYNGGPFTLCGYQSFNASSPKQVVDVLNKAGWKPTDRTTTHIKVERELRHLQYQRNRDKQLDLRIEELKLKHDEFKKTGWKVNETNLNTLPDDAPGPARLLAMRILLESRRRTLTEWLELTCEDGRIRGKFYGIGCWSGRMSHQNPNTANIPTGKKLYANEMRGLWCAPKGRLLGGVDADSIQFRIAAHYIGDPALIKKIIEGKKSDGSDPHSYNKKIIGDFCKSRDASKRTLFSVILGGGEGKLGEILETTKDNGGLAKRNLYKEYPGLVKLREEIVVEDAKAGYFTGLDGRRVQIPGETFSERKHLCPSGYLQNGETVVIRHAAILAKERLKDIKNWFFVGIVHDEYQFEGPNDMSVMIHIAKTLAQCITDVGVQLGCKCPLAGSYWNDGDQDFTIGLSWKTTH